MLRVLFCACVVPAVVSIIVTDYPPTSTEYNYSYNVINPSTGDAKSMQEVRHGGIVRGSYSLIDPDGIRRTVKYTAGPKIGFKAVIHNEPENPPIPDYSLQTRHNQASIGLAPIPYVHNTLPGRPYLPVFKKINRAYFTPGNPGSRRPALSEGEYFIPNKTYQSNKI